MLAMSKLFSDKKSSFPPPLPHKEGPPSYTAASSASSSAFQTTFASISLHQFDRLRLLQFPQAEIDGIRNVILRSWNHRSVSIQAERYYSLSYEFKLAGSPWQGLTKDSIPARVLMREIFAYLYSLGWILTVSTDVSIKQYDKDTLIFRKQQNPPPPSSWMSITFHMGDRLRLIQAPPELVNAFRELLRGFGLIQDEFWKDQSHNAYEFKLRGYPWSAMGEETITTRMILLEMMALLERFGWSLYASIDQNTATEGRSEADSWYCVKESNWTPGQVIFHR